MGTRSLTIAIVNHEMKMAQYGQWDGNIKNGVGEELLEFIHSLNDKDTFNKVKSNLFEAILTEDFRKCTETVLDRSLAGSGVLSLIRDALVAPAYLFDDYNFYANETDCEYLYVLDFDEEVLYIYNGAMTGNCHTFNVKHKDIEKLNRDFYFTDIPFEIVFSTDAIKTIIATLLKKEEDYFDNN